MKILLIVAVLLAVTAAKSYKDHKVVLFKIENEEQLKEMQILEQEPGFLFTEPPMFVNSKIEVVVQPELFAMFEDVAKSTKMTFKVTSENLQSVIDAEKPSKARKEGFALDKYNTLEEIYGFLDQMSATHTTAEVFTVGESFEGRLIKGMKISTSETNPGIFIEANIHAREWISSATSVWLINEILTSTDPTLRALLDSVTWYIVPITNPDGYQFTWDENRLWRKTRSMHNILCRGVDPNRNFGWNWYQGGSSNIACTETYAGPYAFSEKESKALMDFYGTIANKIELYLCFHSAAQLLMYPLGNTASTELVPNIEDLREIAATTVAALEEEFGTVYRYGNAMETLYVTSGSSRDHAYGHYKTPLVFTYEMREGPESIFILPEEQIYPNAKEIYNSLIAMITKSKELEYFKQKV